MSSNPINSPDSPVRPMVVDDIRRLLPSMHDAAGVLTSDPSTADRDASDQHESSELIDEIQAALTCAGDQSNEAPVAHESSPRIIAASNEMRAVMQRVTKVARSSSTALLTGESGVGKTTIAVRIHEESSRSSGPFVVVNCAALPRDLIESELFGHTSGAFTGALKKRAGRIEAAEGGTLFLDEVGDLPIELQPKLLTFLQDRSFYRIGSDVTHHANVRIIAATNRDPRELSAGDRFRPDLYYRLNVLRLHVPPLRDRLEELPALASEIVRRIANRNGERVTSLTPAALASLQRHSWPGNVRELENVLERAIAFHEGAAIDVDDLEFDVDSSDVLDEADSNSGVRRGATTLEAIEARAVRDALQCCDGNRALAAQQLAISERSIYNKIKRFGL